MSFKEQLKNEILPKTVEYYNSGMDINSSIVKAAQDFRLNVDQADRLVEAMNTARVIAHYEKNAEDRTSNCDIADKSEVRRMLFEEKTEKKASAGGRDIFPDYSSYDAAERNYRAAPIMEKAAEAAPRKRATDGFSRRQVVDRVVKYASDLETRRRFAEERRGMAEAAISVSVTKLAESLSKGYEPEERYALFKTACSGRLTNAVKAVDAAMPAGVVKAAVPHLKKLRRANVFDPSRVATEIGAAERLESDLSKMAEFDAIIDAVRKREADTKRLVAEYHGTEKRAWVFGDPPAPPDNKKTKDSLEKENEKLKKDNERLKDRLDKKSKDPWLGERGRISRPVKSLHDRLIPEFPGEKVMYNYLTNAIFSNEDIERAMFPHPEKSTKLRDYIDNVRRSALISDLSTNDPIISEADPKDVSRSYQMLVQTAPETSLNKEIVRSILRQSVNSVAVSPFDAKQWADLDKSLLGNELSRKSLDSHRYES